MALLLHVKTVAFHTQKIECHTDGLLGQAQATNTELENGMKQTITVDIIKEMASFAKKNAIKPKIANDGIEYYELRYRDMGQETIIHTPLDGPMVDLITGERLVF